MELVKTNEMTLEIYFLKLLAISREPSCAQISLLSEIKGKVLICVKIALLIAE